MAVSLDQLQAAREVDVAGVVGARERPPAVAPREPSVLVDADEVLGGAVLHISSVVGRGRSCRGRPWVDRQPVAEAAARRRPRPDLGGVTPEATTRLIALPAALRAWVREAPW